MPKYKALAIANKYWRPGENFLEDIVRSLREEIANGDFVVISEKAISTALGEIVDEKMVRPSLGARLIARYWMRIGWGYFLGSLCHFRERLVQHLREYPLEMGSCHKQVAIKHAGLLQALMFGSEGGIDGSNLAYSYVSLPLSNANEVAKKIFQRILLKLEKKTCVIITDTDKTYSFRNFHFTPRPISIKDIHHFGGVVSYVFGRMLNLKRRSTPIAIAGYNIPVDNALEIAEAANQLRGFGTGRTVWDMAEKFGVELNRVSWEMLEAAKHKPIVIVRLKRDD